MLADFGLAATDPGVDRAVEAVLAHQSPDGALQSVLNVAPAFGGAGDDVWGGCWPLRNWPACIARRPCWAMTSSMGFPAW